MKLKPLQLLSFFMLLVISVLSGCSRHNIEGDKVYYVEWDEARGKTAILIKGADAESFEELEHEDYAIDKNHVYYKAGQLKDANPKTFVSITDIYGKDDRCVYRYGDKIEGADAKSFEVLELSSYSKDKRDYYFETSPMHVSDLKTFKFLNQNSEFDNMAKDKNFYFIREQRYPLADYETFQCIGNGYAKDKFQVYFLDSIVEDADPKTFVSTDFAVAKDKNEIYEGRVKLNIKDPNSFETLQYGFSKDKFHIYYKNRIVEGADPLSFDFIAGSSWQKDKQHFYFNGKPKLYVDYQSFQYLDYDYAKDKNNVYYLDQIVEGADPKTFIHIAYTNDGKDKNACYRSGKKVDCKVLAQ